VVGRSERMIRAVVVVVEARVRSVFFAMVITDIGFHGMACPTFSIGEEVPQWCLVSPASLYLVVNVFYKVPAPAISHG
jgi:hypothetical protein